ncbi:abc transporter [Lucifera butyrica]|uniref:Abc transporter n=1 Tax=Lucifera butyrica TaxID=1351585 RepID=A0A498RES0_9FIRM|nr:ABC transporter ATP-binding protein [Lucifera butyrica]VBB07678.1 abc transporter [Lucifera butyrica]
MSASCIYQLAEVCYRYQAAKSALDSVDLTVQAGEKIVLLGPNGSGKSTLQKILAGLIFATAGTVSAFGVNLTAAAMRDKSFAAVFRQKIGFVFQNSDVQIFCTSVLDEIMFGPLAMGLSFPEAKKRAEELLEYTGIRPLADCPPHHLSGGEKKKVAIAAILAVNPAVLILDEPTNGLDPKSQRWVIDAISELNQRGKTIIVATHHLELLPELADRVVVFGENHRILADGRHQSILADRELLLAANLIDPRYHVHLHGQDGHVHIHKEE